MYSKEQRVLVVWSKTGGVRALLANDKHLARVKVTHKFCINDIESTTFGGNDPTIRPIRPKQSGRKPRGS